MEDDLACSICMEEFKAVGQPEEVIVLDCKHIFHDECLRSWL